MAINYAEKYAEKIAERFHRASLTDADCGHDYSWANPGSRTIKVGSVNTVPETDYCRTGENRFGTVHDVGDTLQEMQVTRAPAFSFTIDALDGSDQAIEKSAAAALRRQLDEVTIPNMDRYRIRRWILGGNIQMVQDEAPTAKTIGGLIMDLNAMMTDALVPLEGRTLYLSTATYKLLKQNSEYLSVDSLGKEALSRGVVGEFDGCRVKPVPAGYLPEGVHFFIKHRRATVDPVKLQKYDILRQVQGYSGPVVQGVTYYDSFVLGAKGDGVAVCATSAVILPAPNLTAQGGSVTASGTGTAIHYTTDGSNPRYSTTAAVYSGPVALEAGKTFRAIAVAEGKVGMEASVTEQ